MSKRIHPPGRFVHGGRSSLNFVFYGGPSSIFAGAVTLAAFAIGAAMFLPALASAATVHEPTTNGLVGYWSFNEGTSTIAHDFSGHGNNGTLSGTTVPTWVLGKLGNALSFDGSSSYVTGPGTGLVNMGASANVTISAWVKPTSASPTATIFSKGASGACFNYGMMLNSGILRARDSSNDYVVASSSVPTNTWTHLVIVFSGSGAQGYVNGSSTGVNSSAVTSNCTDTNWAVGTRAYNALSTFFPGSIDEVRIYNRALSQAEITTLYQSGLATVVGNQSGLVGYWPLDEGSGATATDYSVTENNGTLSGSPLPVRTKGEFGNALNMGSSGYVNITGVSGTQYARYPLTFSFWAKTTATGFVSFIKRTLPAANGSTAYVQGLNLLLTGGGVNSFGVRADTKTVSNQAIYPASPAINDGTWHFLTLTISASGVGKVYSDSVLTGSASFGALDSSGGDFGFPSGNNAGIGTAATTNTQLDDVRVYNTVLTQAEITELYKARAAGVPTANTSSQNLQKGSSVASGLVGYWTFDGAKTQSTIADSSGQGNNGYFVGAATSSAKVAGKLGQALKFNGSTSYVQSSAPYTSVSNWTLSAWIKVAALPQLSQAIYNGNDAGGYGFGVGDGAGGSGSKLQVLFGSVSWLDPSYTLSAGKWYHVVMTRDSATTRVFVNGSVLATTFSNTPGSVINKFSIGMEPDGSSNPYRYFNGIVDDVRVYNRALSAAEVKSLYNMGK